MKLEIRKNDVSHKIEEFAQYLNSSGRIILSAKFGDGKTYFLNELTKDKSLSEKYEFFTVYPVNYSVATNEDVFEYIKRDIILQMHERNKLNSIDIDALFEAIKSFADLSSVVSFLLSFIPGGDLYDKIFNRFWEAKKTYENQKHIADKYLKVFENQRGGLFEKDGYTELIRETVKWIQEDHGSDQAKKTVLIFEDLDRLDPQHLFRILNVLSAHIDDTSNSDKVCNKFGFDNIVLVMDYETTENIFHHFYGDKANYRGYMSKFLACEPFRYNIRDYLVNNLCQQLRVTFEIQETFQFLKNLNGRISKMSIRDISRLCDFDTQNRIKKEYMDICGADSTISTSLPLINLIIFMIESGLSIKEIIEDLSYKPEYNAFEYAILIYPLLYMTNKPFRCLKDIDNDNYFLIVETKDDDILTNVSIKQVPTYQGDFINKLDDLDVETPLKYILEGNYNPSIDLSSVNANRNNSTPN